MIEPAVIARRLVSSARRRAKAEGLAFDISVNDVIVPERCPVLGIKMVSFFGSAGRRGPRSESPTLDKINPLLGYVRGNVRVISHRANRLKSDGLPAEWVAIGHYVDRALDDPEHQAATCRALSRLLKQATPEKWHQWMADQSCRTTLLRVIRVVCEKFNSQRDLQQLLIRAEAIDQGAWARQLSDPKLASNFEGIRLSLIVVVDGMGDFVLTAKRKRRR